MSYKHKTNKKIECPVYLGMEYKCPIMHEVCRHVDNVAGCLGYQQHFISEEEKERIHTKGLAMIVEALGLKKLNGNGKT